LALAELYVLRYALKAAEETCARELQARARDEAWRMRQMSGCSLH